MSIHIHILTIFPEMTAPYFTQSILGKACERGVVAVSVHDLREYALNKHQSVDDRPYGGGAGMVFRPEVVVEAIRALRQKFSIEEVILLSPRGQVFSHPTALELSSRKSFMLVCGRYEGIDQRAIDLEIDREISIGDYVLTGGELGAMVISDAVLRLIPGVVGDEESPLSESHADGLLEYPHYTRPPVFEGLAVPEVLLSGDHAKIAQWRKEQSLIITEKNRPDLLEKKK